MNVQHHRSSLAFAVLAIALAVAGTVAAEESLYPTDYVWRDADSTPLPFQDHETILSALRQAPIVASEPMSRGVAGNIKLTLDHNGTRITAVFRTINRDERVKTSPARKDVRYRDFHNFEVAAYQLDRLLGIGRVPPTTARRVNDQDGTVQIWMEGAAPEDILIERDRLDPPDVKRWWKQKAVMWVFDALIANTDRNQGNLLVDEDWNIWFIDHTRAFRATSKLIDIDKLDYCERRLWPVLKNLDEQTLRETMSPFLTAKEMTKMVLRHRKLIKHFDKKIKKLGKEEVLYDLH